MKNVGIKVDGLMLAIIGVSVLAGVVWFKWGDTIKDVVTKDLNPTSDENLANRAVNSVTAPVIETVTGGNATSLGEMCATNYGQLIPMMCSPFHLLDMVIPE